MQTKVCGECKEDKPFSEYHKNKTGKYGLQSKCKKCAIQKTRDWQVKNPEKYAALIERNLKVREPRRRADRYGLTVDELNDMIEKAGGRCNICKRERQLRVDHDHVTGKVRGLLCHGCNTSLGAFEDNVDHLLAAVEYLKR